MKTDVFDLNSTATLPAIATVTPNCVSEAPLLEARTPILIDPELLKYLHSGIECKVQLASDELELDAYGVPVPKDWKTITLIAMDDKPETIRLLVAAIPELKGYTIIDHWQTIEENPF
jgi:hypothetical protein